MRSPVVQLLRVGAVLIHVVVVLQKRGVALSVLKGLE
ncbi:hypothetical protein BFJ63_vAg19660 [Fusarium oxysporum f. sp. narcissi]|uniref:Uncharacterized protein n=1 Tax=Fusarium oxysporum f. sp. narcissi TaxID=451672 RepID=A0A4V1RXA9_FUSOX|nr:hypothetical protein BFJ63_vAg19660 [Fusarium oxysporum f. sp. narcissi]